MRLSPCSVSRALLFVADNHRHLPDLQGGLFAVAVVDEDGAIRGVGIAGNPPRVWQASGRLVITRVATDGYENACSMIYGALCRAAKALGYSEVWTYTLPEEPGTSLRAAGFREMGLTEGRSHSRASRPRVTPVRMEPRTRWVRELVRTYAQPGGLDLRAPGGGRGLTGASKLLPPAAAPPDDSQLQPTKT